MICESKSIVKSWTELNWTELVWTDLNWTELNWTKLNWTELNWIELNWTELKISWGEQALRAPLVVIENKDQVDDLKKMLLMMIFFLRENRAHIINQS